jgi:hypothetical protein
VVTTGTLRLAVPLTGFVANFSPIPFIAPPPFGRDIDDAAKGFLSPPEAGSVPVAAAFIGSGVVVRDTLETRIAEPRLPEGAHGARKNV